MKNANKSPLILLDPSLCWSVAIHSVGRSLGLALAELWALFHVNCFHLWNFGNNVVPSCIGYRLFGQYISQRRIRTSEKEIAHTSHDNEVSLTVLRCFELAARWHKTSSIHKAEKSVINGFKTLFAHFRVMLTFWWIISVVKIDSVLVVFVDIDVVCWRLLAMGAGWTERWKAFVLFETKQRKL